MVNLRVFGEFRYKISSPENFVNQFVGTFNFATSTEVEERIKEQMVIIIYDSIGDMKNQGMGVADLASNLTNIEQVVLSRTKDHFSLYGVGIDKLSGLYISSAGGSAEGGRHPRFDAGPRRELHAVPDRAGDAGGGAESIRWSRRCRRRGWRRDRHGVHHARLDAAGQPATRGGAARAADDHMPEVRRPEPDQQQILR